MPPFPISQNRREFLLRSGCGFGALALKAMLFAEEKNPGVTIDPTHPYLPRKPHFPARAKSVILLHMVGGPSQVDTFDYKPLLEKLNTEQVPDSFKKSVEGTRFSNVFQECRDRIFASPFKFSRHGQSGMWVSDLYPNVAKHVDDLCFIHSMQADSNNHAPACFQLHTGETVAGKASIGSWITYGLGTMNQDLPGYVLLYEAGPYGGVSNYTNAFLPPAFQPTRLRSEGAAVADLIPPGELAKGQRDSLDFIHDLNMHHRESHPGVSELDARIASYELAYRLQSAGLEIGELDKEPAHIRELYGLDHKDVQLVKFARKCLLARRLVERGVRFVQLYNAFDRHAWDAHQDLDRNHPPLGLQTDQPIAALLTDLKQRGLLKDTLVIWAGEFGRTPMMQGKNGRQHNAAGFTVWLAGGGVKPGQRIGMTDDLGLRAVQDPYGFKDLHATILAGLGLRHDWLEFENGGRPERLTGAKGDAKVIPGVLT